MKIALVGITGKIGSQTALAAKKRSHVVTGISRHAVPGSGELASFRIVTADVFDQRAVAAAAKGHDILASAFGPSPDAILPAGARALAAAARTAGIKRVIIVGVQEVWRCRPAFSWSTRPASLTCTSPTRLRIERRWLFCGRQRIWTELSLRPQPKLVRVRKWASFGRARVI